MKKAINIEETSKNIVRVLSIADETIIASNPTGLEYFVIEDYVEPPIINSPALDINYPMYDKINKKFKWIQVNYQNTASENTAVNQEVFSKLETLTSNIGAINTPLTEKLDMLIELQADKIGGAI